MSKSNFELKINFKEETKSLICANYWLISNELKFEFYVKDVLSKFKISQTELNNIVSENSKFIVRCSKCSKTLQEYISRSDVLLKSLGSNNLNICEKCKLENIVENIKKIEKVESRKKFLRENDFLEKTRNAKISKMKSSLNKKLWQNLNEFELEILVKIMKSKTAKEVHDKIWHNLPKMTNETNKYIWETINKLDKIDLIWVERNEENKILNYHVLKELELAIKLKKNG